METVKETEDVGKLRLRAGDILLYRPASIYGRLIAIKTWHAISHVEVYDGQCRSLASRDGKGVDRYPVRLSELAWVLRPLNPLDLSNGRAFFDTMRGTPYGWLDLLAFLGLSIDTAGIVCSPFAAGFFRACGWHVFPTDHINKVAPFQFLDLVDGDDCEVAYSPADLKNLAP